MTSPDSFSEEEAAARFDDALRQQLGDVEVPPAPAAWETLRAQLPAPTPKPARGRRASFGGGVVVGALLWWGAGQLPAGQPAVPAPAPASSVLMKADRNARTASPFLMKGDLAGGTASPFLMKGDLAGGTASPFLMKGDLAGGTASAFLMKGDLAGGPSSQIPGMGGIGTADSLRGATAGLVPVAEGVEGRDTRLRQEIGAYLQPLAQPADTARPARLRALVAEQTRALAGLQTRLDSVKQFLDALPPAPQETAVAGVADADSVASSLAATEWPTLPPPRSKWSALLLAETTPSWAVLPTRAAQPRQEETVAAHGQQVQGQWQATPRWAVRAGFGQAALTTQARTVAERTGTAVIIDSTLTTDVRNYQTLSVVEIIRRDTIFIYEPILNASLQIIGYDTSFVISADTIRTIVTTTVHDTVHRTVVTERTETLREREQQQFRPTYQFWTLPVGVRYSLLTTPRWTLGAVLGGQLSVFRGGTRPVWTGDAYELRAVGRRDGPYRPVSLSLSAGLEAQYRLSPRLSAVLAPTVRWWAVGPLRSGGAGGGARRLLPAAQLGLSYGF